MLEGKRVLVTGAAAGIGRAVAEAMAAEGARLCLLDLDKEGVVRTAAKLGAMAFAGSVDDETVLAQALDGMDRTYGGIDVLVNNAGISANKPTLDLDRPEWERVMAVNLTAPFLAAQAAARRMAGGGCIVNLASMYGVVAAPERLAYCVSKSGVAMMSKVLAIEWAGRGIRVNAVAPGYVRTGLVEDLSARGRLDLATLERRTPLGRLGTPEEIADVVCFLASDRAGWVTGQVWGIDGGWTAWGYV